jgi:hypothetical protein
MTDMTILATNLFANGFKHGTRIRELLLYGNSHNIITRLLATPSLMSGIAWLGTHASVKRSDSSVKFKQTDLEMVNLV